MRSSFPPETTAAPTLAEEIQRLSNRCSEWFVRECTVGSVHAVWLFKPRIAGPAEASAYDRLSGELVYQRQFGSSGGWAFTPVRQYGEAPSCRPELDSAAAERACAWFEKFGAKPEAEATPEPAVTP